MGYYPVADTIDDLPLLALLIAPRRKLRIYSAYRFLLEISLFFMCTRDCTIVCIAPIHYFQTVFPFYLHKTG